MILLNILTAAVVSPAWATVFGDDGRMTIAEYARNQDASVMQIRTRHAATGQLFCESFGYSGTVQLIGRNDIVVTAGHVFNPDGECLTWQTENKCWVEFPLKSNKRFHIKKGSLTVGGCKRTQGTEFDWAVFELSERAVGIEPYALPGETSSYPPSTEVILAAAFAENFDRGNSQRSYYNFQTCTVRDRWLTDSIGIMHDCDIGHGSSGSALLAKKDGKLAVIGVLVTAVDKLPPGSSYDRDKHFATAATLFGRFLQEVQRRLTAR